MSEATHGNRIAELFKTIRGGGLTREEKAAALNELEKELNALARELKKQTEKKQPKSKYTITVTDSSGKEYSQSISKIKGGKLTEKEKGELLDSIARKMGVEGLTEIEPLDFDFDSLPAFDDMELPDLENLPDFEELAADFDTLDLDFDKIDF